MGRIAGWRAPVCAALVLLWLVAPLACTTSTTAPATDTLGAPARDDRAPLEWARSEPWVIVVRRSCRTLAVYHYGEWVRTFDKIAFGRVPGVKVHEGDRRTPNGLYRIVGKRTHARWTRFMLLDYPNLSDRDDHRRALADGLAAAGPGGEIGIHGTDKERFNQLGIDWTFGCVSLLNDDVVELYDMVPDGTLVLIED